jgi:hypothetical protein
MKVGELVWFHCDAEQYETRLGLCVGVHDNEADATIPAYKDNPREVAEVLYKGAIHTAWYSNLIVYHHASGIVNESR